MTRTRMSPEARRAQIVETAARLFAEKGCAATSVNEIRQACGIAQGTFYWHFPSKESLVDAVVQAGADAQVAALERVVGDPRLGALQRFVAVRDAGFARFAADRQVLEVFHRAGNTEVHHRTAAEARRRMLPALAKFVADGVAEGVFTATDPAAAARFVAAAGDAVDAEALLAEPDGASRFASALTEFVLRGLGYAGPLPAYEGTRP